MESIIVQRLEAVRSMMRENRWDILIITGADPHFSEYPATRWSQVRFLTGFTGEAGDVVITADHAGLGTTWNESDRVSGERGIVYHKDTCSPLRGHVGA